ncbi:tRNA (adenosine(37)-N6)-dimethylallyltransferase MiaA [Nitrincola iocasae]|uniref:tRNA dimethylallyltransferase n=1 Tax=Nitrincola iocasae TaxID=2614693 RepID=A0A5J6LG80_9GAMM|nr:tRNA (adenosine(37)-N6)-dimethylallyltransferase MiaA [Nitrincola iocasae]QEW07630.1 tRNA (adenosine(37)-N6)-dimethylallyltransferase MiaA [Nitrincola iocasae]
MKPLVVCLMGPTASGKTDLAMRLADHLDVELISVDSALIYRGMDIGTAKPDADTLQRYPHHLVNIRDPAESYSAAEFREDALQCIDQALSAGRTPLLVGGTMMYFNALLKGLATLPASDPGVRAELDDRIAAKGIEALHSALRVVDPVAAARLHPTDTQRVQRAMEVYVLTGKTLTQHWQEQSQQELPFRVLSLALLPGDRVALHQRIALRFEQMLAEGFESEVSELFRRGDLHEGMPSMRCVGYRQMWHYLEGHLDYASMHQKAVIATRQLAKRQYTWLRGWPELHILPEEKHDILRDSLMLIEGRVI